MQVPIYQVDAFTDRVLGGNPAAVCPLQAWLDGRLARYKWPRRWLRVDALPKTALGKVQKAALKTLLDAPAAE